ncbi:hypothetical protein KCP76_11815 [Salmonella enterica subsp. enterica serovar Weltevreden]|nr:hypothetical protein KCP76_11815 [Salmonella enterica subsp. enterica serovar Weltevreden]
MKISGSGLHGNYAAKRFNLLFGSAKPTPRSAPFDRRLFQKSPRCAQVLYRTVIAHFAMQPAADGSVTRR